MFKGFVVSTLLVAVAICLAVVWLLLWFVLAVAGVKGWTGAWVGGLIVLFALERVWRWEARQGLWGRRLQERIALRPEARSSLARVTTSGSGDSGDPRRFFDPAEATKTLYRTPTASGEAFRICMAAVRDAQAARELLRALTFHNRSDELLIAHAVASLVALGEKLDRIDQALIDSSVRDLSMDVRPPHGSLTTLVQSQLEAENSGRTGSDAAWFTEILQRRRETVASLSLARQEMRRIHEKAKWMVARQATMTDDPTFGDLDPRAALEDIAEASRTVDALAAGTAEAYLPTRTAP